MRAAATGPQQLRIATVGFQGFGNVGDEAILAGLEAALEGTGAAVRIVFSGPHPEAISAFPAARRMVTWRHLPTLAALRALRGVDLLLLAGGGIFNDHWNGVVPRYAGWVFAARLVGARVAWAGVGVGPLRRRVFRFLTRLAARTSRPVLVRDAVSASLLARAGVPRIIPDPSLFLPRPSAPLRPEDELALVVRAPVASDAALEPGLIEALADLAAGRATAGRRVTLLSMSAAADDALRARLNGALAARGAPPIGWEVLGPTPTEALARLAMAGEVVTVRLHGLLLAALANVPVVPIAYDAKVRAAAKRLGLSDVLVPLDAVSSATLEERLAMAREPQRLDLVRRCVEVLRAERPSVARDLVDADPKR